MTDSKRQKFDVCLPGNVRFRVVISEESTVEDLLEIVKKRALKLLTEETANNLTQVFVAPKKQLHPITRVWT